MSDAAWHIEKDGRLFGPFAAAQLRQLAAVGALARDAVLVDPSSRRIPVAEFPEDEASGGVRAPTPSDGLPGRDAVPPQAVAQAAAGKSSEQVGEVATDSKSGRREFAATLASIPFGAIAIKIASQFFRERSARESRTTERNGRGSASGNPAPATLPPGDGARPILFPRQRPAK